MTKSGFVSIIGQPNVGKSTLLNSLVHEKIAIISHKPETTRDSIKGILTKENCQIVFIDTPGIHKPHDLLGKLMVNQASASILDGDVVLFLTEKKIALNKDDLQIIAKLPNPKNNQKIFLIINKVDKIKDKTLLLPLLAKAAEIYPFDEIIPLCALNKNDVEKLTLILEKHMPENPFFYPEDYITDKDNRFMIQEIIREKILGATHEEIPHSTAVFIEEMSEDKEKNLIDIHAVIYVERLSQKSIVIGKYGLKLKEIGQLARIDIEKLLSRRVYLNLWVKVYEKWKKDPRALQEMGYTE
ncbi:GTPase Era [Candidatus Omnitrophus magneticus]|uniref:GTPase Era n=1 Tax=Candidatus Omnitrophus magneticus TaxID=1609969 RepID=A0A0F0CSF9_9BACT|nr:GTPase Era [Candidatus Omnitrophus magneticus]